MASVNRKGALPRRELYLSIGKLRPILYGVEFGSQTSLNLLLGRGRIIHR